MKLVWATPLIRQLLFVAILLMATCSALQVQVHKPHHHNSPSENVKALSFIASMLPKSGTNTEGRSLLSVVASFLPMFMSQRDDESSTSIPFNITDLLRMIGVDSSKIGTMVINAVVYILEMVSTHFFGGSNIIESRKIDSPGSFLLLLFDTKRAESFLKRISDPDVPNNIINNLQKVSGNDTVCIQQLICKMAPFWWGVNQSVRDLIPLGKKPQSVPLPNIGWTSLLKKYVPSIQEFSTNSDVCETRFPGCIVITYNDKRKTA